MFAVVKRRAAALFNGFNGKDSNSEMLTKTAELAEQVAGIAEDVFYVVAPNQGLLAKLHNCAVKIGQFFVQAINTGSILSPLLFFEALLVFLRAAYRMIKAALKAKLTSREVLMDVIEDLILGSIAVLLGIFLLLASVKIVSIIYVVQASIGFVVSALNVVVDGIEYVTKWLELKKLEKQEKLLTEQPNLIENQETELERIKTTKTQVEKKLAKAQSALSISTKNLIIASIILTLTVLSFVPFAGHGAQIALLAFGVSYLIYEGIKYYQRRQAAKAEQAATAGITTEDAAKQSPSLINKMSNILGNFKQKVFGFFTHNKTNLKQIFVSSTAAALVTFTSAAAATPNPSSIPKPVSDSMTEIFSSKPASKKENRMDAVTGTSAYTNFSFFTKFAGIKNFFAFNGTDYKKKDDVIEQKKDPVLASSHHRATVIQTSC